ncbi:MAG: hypothetical protein K8R73_04075, partial [Clostridiales bacterium]|nr:hypothetical protein [Clostridiales bacterium]
MDGIRVIENIAYSVRIVDQQIVSEFYGEQFIEKTIKNCESIEQLSYSLAIKGGIYCLEVVSPIFEKNEIIGHDLVGFCLNGAIDSLNTGQINFNISSNKTTGKQYGSYDNIYEDDSNVYF